MFRYQLAVAWRILAESVLNLAGLLDLRGALHTGARRPRVAFQAYAEHLSLFFLPIIEALQQQAPEIDVYFIVLPHPQFTFASTVTLRKVMRARRTIPAANIRFSWEARWQTYDVLICGDVYAKFPLRRPRTVLLKHGAGVASRILKPRWPRKTIADFDLVLVNGEADRALLRHHCHDRHFEEKVVAAGLPYLDRLQTCAESRDRYFARLGLAADRKVALLAPSWRGLQAIHTRDPRYFDDLIDVLKGLDWQVIVKMHTCSFNKAMVQGEDWAARVQRYAHPRVRIDASVDDVPAFLHADILVTDISSRAFDFMLLDKPVIAVIPADVFTDELDVERIRLLRQGAQLINSSADLGRAITEGMRECDRTRTERRQVAQQVFANPGRASQAVVGHLLQQLQIVSVS